MRDVTARKESEEALVRLGNDLGTRLEEKEAELARLSEVLQNEVTRRAKTEDTLRADCARLERLLEDTVGAIGMIVQKKDPYNTGHQQRVSQLACAIGREMGLEGDRVRVIRLASLLHDLGMVFIPAEIISKPCELSEVEQAMVREHPEVDYEILKAINFSCPIAEIVHQHHERMNGSGYPSGLKGDDILLESRIIAVADVVEAMMSLRPHRPARGMNEAIKEIVENKGVLYDPDVVDACVRLLEEGRFSFPAAAMRDMQPGALSASSGRTPDDSEDKEERSKGGVLWLK